MKIRISAILKEDAEQQNNEGTSTTRSLADGPVTFAWDERINVDGPKYIKRDLSDGSSYRSEMFLRCSFASERDLIYVRKALRDSIQSTEKEVKDIEERLSEQRKVGMVRCGGTGGADMIVATTNSMIDEKPLDQQNYLMPFVSLLNRSSFSIIQGLKEEDVNYVQRYMIDANIRCGTWYNVLWFGSNNLPRNRRTQQPLHQIKKEGYTNNVNSPPSLYYSDEHPDHLPSVILEKSSSQARLPPLRIFAWDIEVTKAPLAFPHPRDDQVMMISYMTTNHAGLIVNREVVSEDIQDFDYSPSHEFRGFFHCYNVKNERDLLLTFFQHIQLNDPHIHVTYNGDNFDFDYIWRRAMIYGLNMNDYISIPSKESELPDLDPNVPFMRGGKSFLGSNTIHIDCLHWVNRDSYLPMGSRGLKAVTAAKLKYDPRELDPELMTPYAKTHPQLLAEYSVSDALCTYYLYIKYIHTFTLALSTIIPLEPDNVLRKGSGTLCEALLMAQAYKSGIVFPAKHRDIFEKYEDGFFLYSETYAGGKVDQLKSGIFRDDIREKFTLSS